ncbi:MAG TPA: tetratricopeptide repeat protein [Candidatus Egerieousia sp.]|nr:tetratricopeptide repeat protein [Candidatus Egerieousia sp.]HPT05752.1 tetratricopeptide repeat protein [Candidatus Egerieousia sp.]
MSNNNKNAKAQQDANANVGEALTRTEQFFEKYKKPMIYIIGGVIAVAALIAAYHYFIVVPRQKEAQNQMFVAERYFRLDSFNLALNGDGNALGFAKVEKEYGAKAGEAIYMYAGICEFQLGNYDKAISSLKKYKGNDKIMLGRATACIGDAYVNKGDNKTAVEYFKKAADISDNIFSAAYLMKAATSYEALNKKDDALKMYEKIKYSYPNSPEGVEVEKYISRINTEIELIK